MDPAVHAHCASHVTPRRLRLEEEALAALPEGSGPGALTARERRPAEPPGPEAPRGRGHHERCRGLCDSSDLRIPRLPPAEDVRNAAPDLRPGTPGQRH